MNRKLLDCTIYVTYSIQWLIIALMDPRISKVIYIFNVEKLTAPSQYFPVFFYGLNMKIEKGKTISKKKSYI